MNAVIDRRATISLRRLALILGASYVVFSGVVSVVSRWVGFRFDIPLLADTAPSQAWYLLATIMVAPILAVRLRHHSWHVLVYFLGFVFVASIVAMHLALSPPPADDAWNTPLFELLRFVSLQTALAVPFYVLENGAAFDRSLSRVAVVALWLLVWTGIILAAVAVLQVMNIAPQFYFQWYDGIKLARPTGGLEHPHFFAVVLVLCCSGVYWLRSSGQISRIGKYFLIGAYLAGVLVSTSRIGLAVAMIAIGYLELNAQTNRTRARITKVVVIGSVIALALLLGVVFLTHLQNSEVWPQIEAFFAAFSDSFGGSVGSDEFLRGRGYRWAHEIDLITADGMHLFFGYGYQPFVSHNLILRQMQVSGLFGTGAYISMLIAFVSFVRSRVAPGERAYLMAPTLALATASLTFPVLVSVLVISAVAVLTVAVCSSPRSSSWR